MSVVFTPLQTKGEFRSEEYAKQPETEYWYRIIIIRNNQTIRSKLNKIYDVTNVLIKIISGLHVLKYVTIISIYCINITYFCGNIQPYN